MGYSPLSCKESDMTEVTEHAAHVYKLFFLIYVCIFGCAWVFIAVQASLRWHF